MDLSTIELPQTESEVILKAIENAATAIGVRNFIHLHLHTTYSFLDGFNRPEDSARKAKELGMPAMAITDHNHLCGVLDFKEACDKEGIKPILGFEGYWTQDTNILSLTADERTEYAIKQARADGVDVPEKINNKKPTKRQLEPFIRNYEYDTSQYHIIFLAKNQTGWHNLVKLQSEAADHCTYNGRFLCDTEMMRKYSEGVICTTACVHNIVCELFASGKDNEAIAILEEWDSIYGENLYIELQPNNFKKQWVANIKLINWARANNKQFIVTNDVHYTEQSDHDDHDTLLCIGTGKKKAEDARMHYDNSFWVRSFDEMLYYFSEQISMIEATDFAEKDLYDRDTYIQAIVEGLNNTNAIAASVEDVKLNSDKPLFPKLDIPHGLDSATVLTSRCFQNLYKYKAKNPEINLRIYEKRLSDELSIINPKGYAPYMLAVEEYITWANENGVPTGPGRGSAAGSLTLFLLGVTRVIDPIKNGLLFFRFLTADRTSPPDVDTDFDYEGRPRVIEHLEEKYGIDHVAHIGTYSTLGVKSGIKDVARVLDIPFDVVNGITKEIGDILDIPDLAFENLDELKESDPNEWQRFDALEKANPEIFRLARRFEGVARGVGVHASGVLVTPEPVTDLFPTRKAKDGTTVTLYTGVQLEALNAIKFDILGLKTVTVIKKALKAIDENLTFEDLYECIDMKDEKAFKLLRDKKTSGTFQMGSNLFKGLIDDIKPSEFNDLVVITSVARPGPLKAGMHTMYANVKNGIQKAKEPLPNTWDIVEDSQGVIAYQEQVMRISQRVADFNDNQADSYLRKAMAKKKIEKMNMCRQWFIYGKRNEPAPAGYDENNLDQPMYDPTGKHGTAITGGIANGYSEAELKRFWKDIEGYATYLFNLSHAACYSYITILTMYLKAYYPTEFMAALLTMEDDEAKKSRYVEEAQDLGLKVVVPSINESDFDFKAIATKKEIVYGLCSIKGVSKASAAPIIENRPYTSIEDAVERIPKKSFNKRVGIAMIKSGGFDKLGKNRIDTVNRFHIIRKDKDDLEEVDSYDRLIAMGYERETLGMCLSAKSYFSRLKDNATVNNTFVVEALSVRNDRNGRAMAHMTLSCEGEKIKALMFSSSYKKHKFLEKGETYIMKGKKSENSFIVNNADMLDGSKGIDVVTAFMNQPVSI